MRGQSDRRGGGRGAPASLRLDQLFSLFLLLAFILFSMFYLQHILAPAPESNYTHELMDRQLAYLRRTSSSSSSSSSKTSSTKTKPSDPLEAYEWEERRDLGLDVIERELEANEDHTSADEVTFLFAAIDIGTRWQFGDESQSTALEFDEYLQKSLHLITTHFKEEKVRIIVESKSKDVVEKAVEGMKSVDVKYVDAAHLRSWSHFSAMDKIRQAEWWTMSAPDAASSNLGKSDLYATVVMHRLLWLRDLAKENPFKTKYFIWLDAGQCTPRMDSGGPLSLNDLKSKSRYFMDRFMVTISTSYRGHDVQGCHRHAMLRLAQDKTTCFVAKGYIMGGKRNYIIKVAELFEETLAQALPLGCLGTEETILTLVFYNKPQLFHVHYNAPKRVPFDGGDSCKFIMPGEDWKDPDMYPEQAWFQEQKKLAAEKKKLSQ